MKKFLALLSLVVVVIPALAHAALLDCSGTTSQLGRVDELEISDASANSDRTVVARNINGSDILEIHGSLQRMIDMTQEYRMDSGAIIQIPSGYLNDAHNSIDISIVTPGLPVEQFSCVLH